MRVAEYAAADARLVIGVTAEIGPAGALPRARAGAAAYRAVPVGGVVRGDRVAVFGVGGVGHLALEYARIAGGETIAVDVTAERLALARRLGAAHVVDARVTDPVAAIGALGGADVAVAPAARPHVVDQAYASLRRGGRLILVWLPTDHVLSLPVLRTVLKDVAVTGAIVGTHADLAEVLMTGGPSMSPGDRDLRP